MNRRHDDDDDDDDDCGKDVCSDKEARVLGSIRIWKGEPNWTNTW